MLKVHNLIKALILICIFAAPGFSQEKISSDSILSLIKKEGLENSKVMELAGWLTDVHGPRLTGSPGLDRATEWAVNTLEQWGLENVQKVEWGPFGRGWELQHFEMHATEPVYFPIIAYPKAWSPSTEGEVSGEVIYLSASTVEELEEFRGRIGGKFVFLDTLRVIEEAFEAPADRLDEADLWKMANAGPPTPRRFRPYRRSGASFSSALWKLLGEEKPLAVVDRSYKGQSGTVFVSMARAANGRSYQDSAIVVPQVTMAIEHYNRIFRMLMKDIAVTLNMELKTRYTNPDGMEHNIIAEIPGADKEDEVVMFGAHFDSWHAATGATDNAAGSAVMMEVARILQEISTQTGLKPRRTLRLALWTGEEQGLHGSRHYVKQNFGDLDKFGNALGLKEDQKKISAYYNLDNGTGRIRGIYLQGNEEVREIFRPWLNQFSDMDANTITLRNTGGTDHLSFDAVGIPAFQFIQDPAAYGTLTHHSNMDTMDHLLEEDLRQAATIIAYIVWGTAQREEILPRKEIELDEVGE